MARALDAQDRKWQRESDARTLAESEEIKSSPGRLKGAKTEAKVMATRDQKRATAMKKVASGKAPSKKAAPKARAKAAPKARAKAAPKKTASRAKKK